MTFVNLGSQGQHFNEKADQSWYTPTTRLDNIHLPHLLADVMLEEDLLHLAGDDGGVELAGEGGHLVQAGAR